jgi:acyl transferase domain-containing protein
MMQLQLVFLLMLSCTMVRHNAFSTALKASRAITSSRPKQMMSTAEPVSYKTCFVFSGQGAQAVGMAGTLCAEFPAAKIFEILC